MGAGTSIEWTEATWNPLTGWTRISPGCMKPQRIFVNSMSDLFHRGVPEAFIRRVFDTTAAADWHQFQVLTKRADRLEAVAPRLPWPRHVWQGVNVESADHTFRIDHLRRTPAKVKFLSIEPQLGPIPDLDLTGPKIDPELIFAFHPGPPP